MGRWREKDKRYIWHPYTQMKDTEAAPPILIERAKGVKLYDDKGRWYYDTISSWWSNVHGHGHPAINRAIKEQVERLEHVLFAGFTHRPAIELAQRLVEVTPKGLTKVFFSDNGSTSVEAALKMSFQYWQNIGERQKRKFLSLSGSYHGDTIGAMSVSGTDLFNKVFSPLSFDSYKAPAPYCYRCPVGKERESCQTACVGLLERILKKRHKSICAFILEPIVMGAGGMIVYPAEYLKRAAALAKKYKVHLILDEVATGFGRTGRMFACEHAGVEPDLMCLSKGITGGYLPLGATLTTDKIYKAFYADYDKLKTFYHGHTYTANPISCAAAVASLDLFRKEKTLQRIKKVIPLLHKGLKALRDLPHVGDVRYIGMIGAVELVKDKARKEPFGFEERVGYRMYQQALKENLILRPLGNVVYLFLPLSIRYSQLRDILWRTRKTIKLT